MTSLNNPAGRLHRLLEQGRKQVQPSRKKTVGQAWAELLEVSEGDVGGLFHRLAKVASLPGQIREQVERYTEADKSTFIKHLPKIEQAFAELHLQGRWEDFINRFDSTTMYGLEICDELLSQHRRDISADIEDIQREVRELVQDVENGDLPDDLRRYLLKHLREIDAALLEYRFGDEETIGRALDVAVGAIVRQPKVGAASQQMEVGKRFWRIISRVATVLGLLKTLSELGERIHSFLPTSDETQRVYVEEEGFARNDSLPAPETDEAE